MPPETSLIPANLDASFGASASKPSAQECSGAVRITGSSSSAAGCLASTQHDIPQCDRCATFFTASKDGSGGAVCVRVTCFNG